MYERNFDGTLKWKYFQKKIFFLHHFCRKYDNSGKNTFDQIFFYIPQLSIESICQISHHCAMK